MPRGDRGDRGVEPAAPPVLLILGRGRNLDVTNLGRAYMSSTYPAILCSRKNRLLLLKKKSINQQRPHT
jgi:hypothetical protein